MLDIKLFRENIDIILESEKRRRKDLNIAKMVLETDKKWRETLKKVEEFRRRRNELSRMIAEFKKKGKDVNKLKEEAEMLNKKIRIMEKDARKLLEKREKYRYMVGNILAKDVPDGIGEENNVPIRFWGKAIVWKGHEQKFLSESKGMIKYSIIDKKPFSHVDVIEKLDIVDIERASKVSGSRFFYLKRELVILNLAIQMYAIKKLIKKGFVPVYTPFMMKYEFMKGAAELTDFEQTLYKVEKDNLLLIATAEQTLAAMHANEILEEVELPKLYVGFSTNFRREAGAHGKDTKGIFRVHQFDKVEQYVFCLPEHSWEWHEKLIRNAEELFQEMEIPYRIVNICAGDMNDNAAKKYDIEVWMPAQGRFREVVSCSNTTDYQARKLNVRVLRKNGRKETVHTLNSTAIATQRCMVAIIENFQREKGIVIPKVLRKYTDFDLIPWRNNHENIR